NTHEVEFVPLLSPPPFYQKVQNDSSINTFFFFFFFWKKKKETYLLCHSVVLSIVNDAVMNRLNRSNVHSGDNGKKENSEKSLPLEDSKEEKSFVCMCVHMLEGVVTKREHTHTHTHTHISQKKKKKTEIETETETETKTEEKEKEKEDVEEQEFGMLPIDNSKHTTETNNNTEWRPGKFGWCVVCGAAASHYCIQTTDPVCSLECKVKNLELVLEWLKKRFGKNATTQRLEAAYKATLLINDGHLLFRSLCSQSLQTLPADSPHHSNAWFDWKIPRLLVDSLSQSKPGVLRSKTLSLELLRLVFGNAGRAFRSSHRFLDSIRESFIPVVAENAASTVEGIFQFA
ncbi:hypothetical protein RFI_20404, partial [Reticulomyxa filosa]